MKNVQFEVLTYICNMLSGYGHYSGVIHDTKIWIFYACVLRSVLDSTDESPLEHLRRVRYNITQLHQLGSPTYTASV